eukprot:Gb_14451 [translate_table: standard]
MQVRVLLPAPPMEHRKRTMGNKDGVLVGARSQVPMGEGENSHMLPRSPPSKRKALGWGNAFIVVLIISPRRDDFYKKDSFDSAKGSAKMVSRKVRERRESKKELADLKRRLTKLEEEGQRHRQDEKLRSMARTLHTLLGTCKAMTPKKDEVRVVESPERIPAEPKEGLIAEEQPMRDDEEPVRCSSEDERRDEEMVLCEGQESKEELREVQSKEPVEVPCEAPTIALSKERDEALWPNNEEYHEIPCEGQEEEESTTRECGVLTSNTREKSMKRLPKEPMVEEEADNQKSTTNKRRFWQPMNGKVRRQEAMRKGDQGEELEKPVESETGLKLKFMVSEVEVEVSESNTFQRFDSPKENVVDKSDVIPSDDRKEDEGDAKLLEREEEEEGLDCGEGSLGGDVNKWCEELEEWIIGGMTDIQKEESKATSDNSIEDGGDEKGLAKEVRDKEVLTEENENSIGGVDATDDIDSKEMSLDKEKKNEGFRTLENDLCLSIVLQVATASKRNRGRIGWRRPHQQLLRQRGKHSADAVDEAMESLQVLVDEGLSGEAKTIGEHWEQVQDKARRIRRIDRGRSAADMKEFEQGESTTKEREGSSHIGLLGVGRVQARMLPTWIQVMEPASNGEDDAMPSHYHI